MKMGLQFVTPLWFAATRMFLGALCLFAFLALKGGVRLPGRGEISILVSVAVFQIALPTRLVHIGLSFMDAGRSAILVFTIPLWVAPIAFFALGERLTRMNLVGLAMGLAGIAVLFNPLSFNFSNPSALTGNGFMFLASMSFAVAIILIRRHTWRGPIIQLMPWQMLLGTALLVVAAAAIEGDPGFEWSAPLIAIMVYNGPVASGFCFWAYVTVSRNLPAMSTALGSLRVPVLDVLFSALILGEEISLIIVSGLILISIGVLAVTVGDLKQLKFL